MPGRWEIIRHVQPFHFNQHAHKNLLAALQWLSNRDKHRAVRIVDRLHIDAAMDDLVQSDRPIRIVERWVHDGPIEDRTVLVRVKFERPSGEPVVDLKPVFVHGETVQIGDDPAPSERTLASTLEQVAKSVLGVLYSFNTVLGLQTEFDSLYLGEPMSGDQEVDLRQRA